MKSHYFTTREAPDRVGGSRCLIDSATDEAYLLLMQEALGLWPSSRFAHAGLAEAFLASGYRETANTQMRRAALAEFKAALVGRQPPRTARTG